MDEFIIDSNTLVSGTESGDTFYIGASNYPVENVTVNADGGNDEIYNQYGARAYIDSGEGNDYIYLYSSASQSTVATGAGDDTVISFANGTVNINAGAGSTRVQICDDINLVIRGSGTATDPAMYELEYYNDASIGGSTLIGAGNAVLLGTTGTDIFVHESGDNYIVNYGGEDTIRFAVNRSSVSGDDVVLINANGDRLFVQNAAGHTLNVQADENSSPTSAVFGGAYSTSPQDVIKKFMHSLNNTTLVGIDAVNEAVRAASNGEYSSVNALIADMTLDAYNHGGDSFLRDDCGIILGNQDTGAISGWDAGGSTVKNAESIVPESGSMLSFRGNSFTVDGVTIKLDRNFSQLTTAQQQIVRGLCTWWTAGALDLIKESYGSEFSFDEGDVKESAKTITLEFTTSGSALAFVSGDVIDGETSEELTLTINMRYYNSVDESNVNGESNRDTAGYLDRTLAHEFTHAIMAATINDFYSLPAYISEGMAELTHGIDDERGNDLEALAENPSYIVRALSSSDENVNSFGGINAPSYAGGYMLLRYLAKKFSVVGEGGGDIEDTVEPDDTTSEIGADNVFVNYTINSLVSGSSGDDTIDNRAGGSTLRAEAGDDYITTSTEADYTVNGAYGFVTVDAGEGNDTVVSSDHNVSINGGAGNDSINVGSYNDLTLRAGEGDDSITGSGARRIYQYSAGDGSDMINGWQSSDTLSIVDGSNYFTLESGNDVLVSIGSGSITLKDAVDKTLNIDGGTFAGYSTDNYFLNYTVNSLVGGSAGNDTIDNRAGGATLRAEAGDDYITTSTEADYTVNGAYGFVTVDAGAGNDTVVSNDHNVSINGGDGNDLINTGGYNNITVRAGEGDDSITGTGARRVYQYAAGDGSDVINGWQSSDTLSIVDGSNYFTLESGNDVLVSIGSGSITLKDAVDKTLNIDGGTFAGYSTDNYFLNYTVNSLVGGSAGNDTIDNRAGGATLRAEAGDDYITTSTEADYTVNGAYGFVTVDAGAGNDTVVSNDHNVSINGGAGNDSINVGSYNDVTLRAGEGDDSITGSGARRVYQYANGDGSDVINGYQSSDTLSIVDGSNYFTLESGNDVLVSIGSGSITLKDAVDKTLNINGGTFAGYSTDNYFLNYTVNSLVSGSASNDTIDNRAGGSTLRAEAGDDYIITGTEADYTVNGAYGFVTVDAGAGNDTVVSNDHNVSINGGAGNDVINTGGYNDITVRAGEGDDSITGSGARRVYQYANGDGSDVINGWQSSDTISIIDDSNYFTLESGNDVLVSIGSGSITLKDAVDKTLNIDGGSFDISPLANPNTNYTPNSLVSGTDNADTLYNYAGGSTILARDGDDYILSSTGDNYTVNGGYGYVTIDAGAGNDTVENDDPNVSINAGAGNDSINIGSWNYITINGGAGNDLIDGDGDNRTFQYADGDGHDTITALRTNDTIAIADASAYYTLENGDDVILQFDSGSITLSDARGLPLNITGGTASVAPSVVNEQSNVSIGGSDGDDLIINTGDNVTINAGKGNDLIDGDGDNRTFQYADGDGHDTITALRPNDTIAIADASAYYTLDNGDDVILQFDNGSITFSDARGIPLNITGGTASVEPSDDDTTSAAPSGDDTTSSDIITVDPAAPSVKNSRPNVSILGSAGDDDIINTGSNVSILGSAGDDDIINTGSKVSISGGDGDDIITNLGTDSTLTGGDGWDLFQLWKNSSAHITDLTDEDALEIYSTDANGFTYSISRNDITLRDDTGSIAITLDGTTSFSEIADVNVKLFDDAAQLRSTTTLGSLAGLKGSLPDGVKLNKAGTTLTIKKQFVGTINAADYGDSIKTIKASSNPNALELIGNDIGNKITASKGGSTLEGAGGNDTLNGGKGADLFIYDGRGNDVIKKYKAADKVLLADEITDVSIKGSSVILTSGEGTLTIKSVLKKELTIIDGEGAESTYRFTKQNTDLESALISKGDQLPREYYWFEDDENPDKSPLEQIVEPDGVAELAEAPLSEPFKQAQKLMLNVSSPSRRQK